MDTEGASHMYGKNSQVKGQGTGNISYKSNIHFIK
ncbi:hypothetical protein J2Z42_000723 [Clostridium algifaecis]|uniref:Uncharacterized protein n=1 Tax=Clostridium algifaecis TaxID=1472040 RepID=A0ABS4KPT6_9CLOT|nr:hypothetical protein [Clostridium algifaecis]